VLVAGIIVAASANSSLLRTHALHVVVQGRLTQIWCSFDSLQRGYRDHNACMSAIARCWAALPPPCYYRTTITIKQ